MRSTTRLVLGPDGPAAVDPDGRVALAPARLVDVATEPPVVVRHAGRRVLFGASAAGPLGGDHLDTHVEIEPDVCADLGTVGAMMVLPNRPAAPSATVTTVRVGARSRVWWRPEPMISVAGSVHDASLIVQLDEGATCRLVEEFALGRTGESSGELRCTLRVERGGLPLVHHVEHFGPAVAGAGSVAAGPSAGHVVSAVFVGTPPTGSHADPHAAGRVNDAAGGVAIVDGGCWAGWFPLAPDASMVIVVGPDRPSALDRFDRLAEAAMV